jgi:protein NrfD
MLQVTSTLAWAAAPQQLAVRFGASSVASAAAALALGARSGGMRRTLETVACTALAVEVGATIGSAKTFRDRGIEAAAADRWSELEKAGAIGLGVLLPPALYTGSRLLRGSSPPGRLSDIASAAVLAGSLMLRITTLGLGAESASRPEVSFAFAEPPNPPRRRHFL